MCFIYEKRAAVRHQNVWGWVRREGSSHTTHGARSPVGQLLPGLVPPLPKLNIRHSHHHERPRSAEKGLLNSIQSGHFPPLHRHKQPPPCVLHLGRAAARQCRDCTIPGPAGQPTSQRSWEDTLVQVCPLLSIISQCIYGAILPPNFSLERPEIFEGFKRNFWQQKKKERKSHGSRLCK